MVRRPILLLGLFLLLATAGRLWIASALPLVDDEAYYWAWAQRPAWGYPDHPPAIAGLIWVTTTLTGNAPLGIRLGPVLLALGTSLLLFDLGRMMFGPSVGVLAAAAYQIIPSFAVGSLFAFPDAPFIFFWTLAVWSLWRARSSGRAVDWYVTGLAAGLAAVSKLSALFLGISLVGFLAATPGERHWWRRPEPYRAAAIALAVFLPVVSWNAAHGWIMFDKTRDTAPWITMSSPALNALAFVAAQLAYYGPLTAPFLVAALAASASRRSDRRHAFLMWSAAPIIVTTWVASFGGIPKPHWHAPGFVMALVSAAALWSVIQRRRWWRAAATAAVLINLAAIAALVVISFRRDASASGQLWGWEQVAAAVEREIQRTPPSPGRFVMASRYQTAGQVEFHLHRRHLVATPYGGDAYDLWVPDQHVIDWNAIYFNDLPLGPGVPIERMFRRVEVLLPIEVTLDGRVVRTFWVYRGLGFRGMPRPTVRPK